MSALSNLQQKIDRLQRHIDVKEAILAAGVHDHTYGILMEEHLADLYESLAYCQMKFEQLSKSPLPSPSAEETA